jgi:hypothetical protein
VEEAVRGGGTGGGWGAPAGGGGVGWPRRSLSLSPMKSFSQSKSAMPETRMTKPESRINDESMTKDEYPNDEGRGLTAFSYSGIRH